MVEVFDCDLELFARIFGANLRRFRSKIARFCIRFGAILARKTRASTANRVQSSLAVTARLAEHLGM